MKEVGKNFMELRFASKSENEAFARIAVASFVSQLDPTVEELTDIKTVVSEAVTNAVIHGYEEKGDGTIYVRSEIEGKRISITISDQGVGIADVNMARQPLYTSKPELERSGMGFTIMENFMDEVLIHSKPGHGTTVHMVKHLKSRHQTMAN
ncbi:anti-sigma F factor [Laceyella sacchari]|jgi:stage II sporulation protein AB (anti-sigma F factor)|uniref:Anti-sigma F factor n=2 Tax=Laceyella TaxID=292635 RepID=A0AA45WR52_9BACL|nr:MULTISPECIES: anti-sigma F factor [Laceyella]KPC77685.1 anti-sigma F factor [Thermoactinomyces vulgaris]AUS08587.1 anti-sigma F factor [Laceyella sacchari]MRG28016.1 anti-sigma F factor [Laceyella tengchongensis]TCW41258.1 stage II sporulation protein AB (anti-sigma F factor) [Laceyella sacchari]UWE04835.1 anti-sigma F factor [Laceyella sacchari]